MQTLQLEIRAGHMFVRVGDDLFLLDTGAPSQFQTETHTVDIRVGKSSFRLRCGSLPGLLGMTLMMAGTEGILGNQIVAQRNP